MCPVLYGVCVWCVYVVHVCGVYVSVWCEVGLCVFGVCVLSLEKSLFKSITHFLIGLLLNYKTIWFLKLMLKVSFILRFHTFTHIRSLSDRLSKGIMLN